MPRSMTEAYTQSPPVETPEQKRIRELAAKTTPYTNVEIQDALRFLLGERAEEISRRRAPRP